MHRKFDADWIMLKCLVEIASEINYNYSTINNFVILGFSSWRFDWLISRIITNLRIQICITLPKTADLLKLYWQDLNAHKRFCKNFYFWAMDRMLEYLHATNGTKFVEPWLARSASPVALRQCQTHHPWTKTSAGMSKAMVWFEFSN